MCLYRESNHRIHDKSRESEERNQGRELTEISCLLTKISYFVIIMKKYPAKVVLQLIEAIAEAAREDLSFKGFQEMELKVGGSVGEKYLYKKYNEVEKKPDGMISIQSSKLDDILQFLGFADLESFQYAIENPIHELLGSCAGNWLSYVRQNSHNGILYVSPVRIYREQGKMLYELSGPHQGYLGELKLQNEVLYALFEGSTGKQFHHVYKLGSRHSPNVLQGTFSGASTSGEPIAGRTVLIRQKAAFEELKGERLKIKDLLSSESEDLQRLGQYFESFEKNNLRIERVDSYEVDDLG